MKKIRPRLITDLYFKKYGTARRLYEIACGSCKSFVCYYQKDGPGLLKRMYIDRISGTNGSKLLLCTTCKALLGYRYAYEKHGGRLAYKLFVAAVNKKFVAAQI